MRYLTLILCLLPLPLWANDWDALRVPGAMAIMRHALAPGTGDPAHFRLGDCTTQRNLDQRGQAQARTIGAAFRENGVNFDAIWASQWCRGTQTAELLNLGPVTQVPALNSFFRHRARRDGQTRELIAMIRQVRGPVMMVTHQVNISALTGQTARSGEVLVIRDIDGQIEVLGRIMIDP